MNAREISKPRRLVDRRRRVLIWRLVITLVILGGLLGGLVVFLRLPVLAIKNIEVQGASALDKAELAAVAESVLQNNFTGLFPRKNFLIYPRRQIKETLSERFQRIEQMSLKVEEDNILVVEIKERQGEYLWCGLDPTLSKECFFTDRQGYIFDQAPYFSGNVYFKIYSLPVRAGLPYNSSAISRIGSQVFPPEDFMRLTELKHRMETLRLAPVYFWIKQEGECVARGSAGFEIFFLCTGNLEETAENLSAALQAEPFAPDYEKRLPDLLYLDLRHDNKVFFKFK